MYASATITYEREYFGSMNTKLKIDMKFSNDEEKSILEK